MPEKELNIQILLNCNSWSLWAPLGMASVKGEGLGVWRDRQNEGCHQMPPAQTQL